MTSFEDRVNILLVDDRPDKLMALEATLESLGQNLVPARSGKEALRCLLRQDFAVILLDVNMPVMDGFETASLIRQRKNSELTPIIFVSAVNDTETHLSRGYSLGAVDYILAPIVPEILRAKVNVFVDLFKKTEQVKRQAVEHAQFIREQAARTEAEAAQRRAAFLAEASSVLAAASLDYRETLQNLAQLAVPTLADFCWVDMLEKEGAVMLMALAHSDPSKVAFLHAVREREPLRLDIPYFVPKALRTGRTEVLTDLSDAALESLGWKPQHREIARNLDMASAVIVPLVARGRTLGAISLVMAESGRAYTAREISLAEELAQRAALAVDNALLYTVAQEARSEAEAASNAKDRFLAMLSHELRTPLTPVLNTVQALQADPALPAQLRPSVEMIRRNVELEARLIDDLLDLTRISKGKVQLNLETVDAHELMRTTLQICQDEIEAKLLHIDLELAATRCLLHADAARLHQVFWNLLRNAIKFTPAGGRITLRSSNFAQKHIRIEVIDTGIGMTSEMLPRVFDAFEQAEHGRLGGLGLGLAIAKAIVDLHRGHITASSAGPHLGATFRVELETAESTNAAGENASSGQVATSAASSADTAKTESNAASSDAQRHDVPAQEKITNQSGNSVRILLVDDHLDTILSMQVLLQRRGYHVTTAGSVQAALKTASQHEFDVLISDVGLPDGSGMDLMRSLRQSRDKATLIGIALSGYGMEEDVARSRAAGFDDHLIKPTDIQTLEASIERLRAGALSALDG